ncbi:MAG: hypothetical protein ACK5Y2_04455 [Bdellovibrionales bacterium]
MIGDMGSGGSEFSVRQVFQAALLFLHFEKREIYYIIVYTVMIGAVSFASTVSIQFLVNQITFTGQAYPVILLGVLTVIVLIFGTVLQVMRHIVIELIQQRIFVRTVFGAVDALGHAALDRKEWDRREIVHRYFDVFSYQKALSVILLDGIGIVIVTVLGTIIVTFYHPFLSFFTLFIIAIFAFIVAFFFRKAVETNYEQSSQKYRIGAWLSDIAENRSLFWNSLTHKFALDRTDAETQEYLKRRQAHFSALIWQQGGLYVLQAAAAGLLLGVGGILVVLGQLNLGQLVAAEVILMAVLAGLVYFGKTLENTYDLMTAGQKLMPLLSCGNFRLNQGLVNHVDFVEGAKLEVFSEKRHITATLSPGDIVGLRGQDSESRREFLWHLIGFETSPHWDIEIQKTKLQMIAESWKRENIFFVDRPSVFDVDLRLNLSLSTAKMIRSETRPELLQDVPFLTQHGLKIDDITPASQWAQDPRVRLHVALTRALFTQAKIVVIDELFMGLGRDEKREFLEHFRRHCKDKLLIVNCDADLDLPVWTKVITWT